MGNEFIFRFQLDNKREKNNNLEDMVKQQLISLLNIVELKYGDQIVKVDSFCFINDQMKTYKIY